ncbi:hypothetical protein [Phyllobacterium phragmitis]
MKASIHTGNAARSPGDAETGINHMPENLARRAHHNSGLTKAVIKIG